MSYITQSSVKLAKDILVALSMGPLKKKSMDHVKAALKHVNCAYWAEVGEAVQVQSVEAVAESILADYRIRLSKALVERRKKSR